jgi:uncharacterized MAPEG superfamily protein
MYEEYLTSISGLWVILFTVLLQNLIASIAHRLQTSYIPGVINEKLGHTSFVFRSHRTFQNSLENVLLMVGPAILAILVGVDAFWLALLIWVFALSRLMHMALYYLVATEKNPSPRSYFYMLALLSNLSLFFLLGAHLV